MATIPEQPVILRGQASAIQLSAGEDDLATVCAVSALAFMISDVLHAALGHALVALLTISPFGMLTSAGWSSAYDNSLSDMAGPLISLLAATVFWLFLRWLKSASMPARLFLLLACAFCLLQTTGLLFLSGITTWGDWASLFGDTGPALTGRIVLVLAGALSYGGTLALIGFGFVRYLDLDPTERRRIFRLTLAGYLSVLIVSGLAAALNPIGLKFLALSEFPPTLAADAGLLWVCRYMRRTPSPGRETLPVPRSRPWIAISAAAALAFILILGRGIALTGRLQ